ncbi:MAG: hypothetical protein ACK4N5_03965 [Myxococcales bacterium]
MKKLLVPALLFSTGCVATVRPPPVVVSPTPTAPPPVVVVSPAPEAAPPPRVIVVEPAPQPAPPPPEVSAADAQRIALEYAYRRGFPDARVKDLDAKKDHWKVKLDLPRGQGKIKLEIDRFDGTILGVDEDLKKRGRGHKVARND